MGSFGGMAVAGAAGYQPKVDAEWRGCGSCWGRIFAVQQVMDALDRLGLSPARRGGLRCRHRIDWILNIEWT